MTTFSENERPLDTQARNNAQRTAAELDPKHLTLRFSNQKDDTIKQHEEIITRHGSVWWGWWAKSYEPRPTSSEWAEIRASIQNGQPVALVDRRNARYYQAACAEVQFTEVNAEASLIPSPDAALTPEYYASQTLPAWFRFERIEAVRLQAYKGVFGELPSFGDTTLWWKNRTFVPPLPIDEISARTSTILHLSDLHFTQSSNKETVSDADFLAQRLRDKEKTIGIVLLTGDLSEKEGEGEGEGEGGYAVVTLFLDQLLDNLQLDKSALIVVPGNSDMSVPLDEQVPFDYSHEQAYREWYSGYFENETERPLAWPDRSIERLTVFSLEDGSTLSFIHANSSRPWHGSLEYSYVGYHRLEDLVEACTKNKKDHARFLVMHNHLTPLLRSEISPNDYINGIAVDAGEIIDRLKASGFSGVFHGHGHEPCLSTIGRASFDEVGLSDGHLTPMFCISCGMSGQSQVFRGFSKSKTIGVYEFEENHMQAQLYSFDAKTGGFQAFGSEKKIELNVQVLDVSTSTEPAQ